MKQNPEAIVYNYNENGLTYAIRYIRADWNVLMWIQDLTGRKLKREFVNRPIVIFNSKEEAEQEIINVVIPYIQENNKGEISGW